MMALFLQLGDWVNPAGLLLMLSAAAYATPSAPQIAALHWNTAVRLTIAAASHEVFGRAIPCSAVAQQRHKVIRNGVALVGEESVSGVTGGTVAGSIRRPHPCVPTSSAMTESRSAAKRQPQ